MPEASSDVLPFVMWLSTLEPWERLAMFAMAGGMLMLMLRHLPAIGEFVARVIGRGETAREKDLAEQVSTLTSKVATLDHDIGRILHTMEEHLTTFEALLKNANCLDPTGRCALAANVDAMRDLAARWREGHAALHGELSR